MSAVLHNVTRFSATVEDAKALLATEEPGSQLFALANTIVSNAQTIKILNQLLNDRDRELSETKRTLRTLSDSFDDQSEEIARLRKAAGFDR